MARISHNDVNKQEYAMTHNWDIGIPVPQFIPSFITAPLKGPLGFLNLYCESSDLPDYEIEMMDIRVNGIQTSQPGQTNMGQTLQLIFYEDNKHFLFKFFEYWKKLLGSPKTHAIVARQYCMIPRGFMLNLLDGDGSRKLTYELWGVAPTVVKLDPLSGDGQLQKLNVTLHYINYEIV